MATVKYNIEPDWYNIKQAYEHDETLSVRAIAKKYKVTPERIYRRVKRDEWQKPLARVVSPVIHGDKSVTDFVKEFITRILKETESTTQVSEWYKDNRAMLFRRSQINDLALIEAIKQSVTKAEMKKWTPQVKAKWIEVLNKNLSTRYGEERLEEGESTENVSVIYKHILKMQERDAIARSGA